MKYEYYRDGKYPQKEWRWRLLDDEGETIAASQDGHPTKDVCLAEIELVKSSFDAEVVEDLGTLTPLATLLGKLTANKGAQP
jgi:uncharacterized protein YegP (UPF0339 family)